MQKQLRRIDLKLTELGGAIAGALAISEQGDENYGPLDQMETYVDRMFELLGGLQRTGSKLPSFPKDKGVRGSSAMFDETRLPPFPENENPRS
jgi:hypothetical protein